MHIFKSVIPSLEFLEEHSDEPLYIADDRVGVHFGASSTGLNFTVTPIGARGGQGTVSSFKFLFLGNSWDRGVAQRQDAQAMLANHLSFRDIAERAAKLNWRKEGNCQFWRKDLRPWKEMHFTQHSMYVSRSDRAPSEAFSPDMRVAALAALPQVWTKEAMVRALMNGQAQETRVLIPRYDYTQGPRTSSQNLDFAWALLERWPQPWTILFEFGRVQARCPGAPLWSTFIPHITG